MVEFFPDVKQKNKNSPKDSKLAGLEFGLQLKLYVNIYEQFLSDTSNVYGLGALIRIGNSSYSSDYSNGDIFLPWLKLLWNAN